jgi:2,3-bisphosphoglycerate-independent phosphoglycerate mutase
MLCAFPIACQDLIWVIFMSVSAEDLGCSSPMIYVMCLLVVFELYLCYTEEIGMILLTGLFVGYYSETQKFGHVTFFWNGNRSGKVDDTLETYHEVPSDNIQFNKKPHMKAAEIAKAAQQALLSGEFDYVRVNFANGDMVGHTGDLEATKLACESVDQGVKLLVDAVESCGGIYMITADHGNCDDMAQRKKNGEPLLDNTGKVAPLTSHTLAPVLILYHPSS